MDHNEESEPDFPGDGTATSTAARGRWQLAGVLAAVVVLWGVVFPAISETASQRAVVRRLELRGLDPMALFYTDHPSSGRRVMSKPESSDADVTERNSDDSQRP